MDHDGINSQDSHRASLLAITTHSLPLGFWTDLQARARQVYLDVFNQTLNDPGLLPEQRIDSLYQQRHFRMEFQLKTLADAYGLAASPTLLVENRRRYVYVSGGSVGLTQAYVSTIGELPKPARFRERLSALNKILLEPGFDFGLEPRELLKPKAFYGVIAHNPVGKRFDETDQTLGMIQLCVPMDGCRAWAAQFTLQELIGAYEDGTRNKKQERGPVWKTSVEERKKRGGL
jgi:hypothetical protein